VNAQITTDNESKSGSTAVGGADELHSKGIKLIGKYKIKFSNHILSSALLKLKKYSCVKIGSMTLRSDDILSNKVTQRAFSLP
jgi:hypothetical protein